MKAVSPQQPADEGVSQSVGQTPRIQLADQSQHSASHELRHPRLTAENWELQRQEEHSLQLGVCIEQSIIFNLFSAC